MLAWTGLPQILLIPLVPRLMKSLDVRYIAFVGIALFAASCFLDIELSYDVSGDQFLTPNIVRAIGQALIITPLTAITLAEIAPKDAGNASACPTCCAIWAAPSARPACRPSSPSASSSTPTSSASR
ncbi:MAG: hypothetical protein WDN69_32105 [Aliidongia sp.]